MTRADYEQKFSVDSRTARNGADRTAEQKMPDKEHLQVMRHQCFLNFNMHINQLRSFFKMKILIQ